MGGRARGFWRAVDLAQARFLPAVPFAADDQHKGWWEQVTRAPRHVWRHYRLAASVPRPLTCAVLSDLHAGSQAGDLDRFEAIVSEVLARRFDLILLPGDFVNMQLFGGGRIRPEALAEILAPLARAAPAVAVLGNHDAEYGRARVTAALEGQGIRVLSNSSACVETAQGPVHVAGLEDHSSGTPDVASALSGIEGEEPVIVLAHDPASFADVPEGPAVTICGHTHGGQMRLPLLGAVVNASAAPLAWTHGHIVEGRRHLIVSAGLGTSGLPWRINCPPEIVAISLEPC
ncbi:metallophosphoesterase [Aestuariivirga sp.]|uniref:metallophosphoesterase n=1 Tax=Aestuariivirga sp. TaxID=2650926 RepID=UPI00391A7E6F